jgi:cytochrome P450
VNPAFTPKRIDALRPVMRKRIAAPWETLAAKRHFNFVTDCATKLPAMAIADLRPSPTLADTLLKRYPHHTPELPLPFV